MLFLSYTSLPAAMDIDPQSDDSDINDTLMLGKTWSTDEDELIVKIASNVGAIVAQHSGPYYDKIPYHTSALSGHAWVQELLSGHPERIRCELGVHVDIFDKLIRTLLKLGYADSKYVTLQEQLSIFLYTCVTGLTIYHVGERFQRPGSTISK